MCRAVGWALAPLALLVLAYELGKAQGARDAARAFARGFRSVGYRS
jgi:Ser/Thr protein kinase RdoA (MazF antagonist)